MSARVILANARSSPASMRQRAATVPTTIIRGTSTLRKVATIARRGQGGPPILEQTRSSLSSEFVRSRVLTEAHTSSRRSRAKTTLHSNPKLTGHRVRFSSLGAEGVGAVTRKTAARMIVEKESSYSAKSVDSPRPVRKYSSVLRAAAG